MQNSCNIFTEPANIYVCVIQIELNMDITLN